MKKNTRWVAKWVESGGRKRKYIFDGPENRVVARLDFQLKMLDQREKVPEEFELDEWATPQGMLQLPTPYPRPTDEGRPTVCEEDGHGHRLL